MDFAKVPAGKEIPEDIYVVIEIPANADPIKYEIDKDSNAVFVDRFMATPMFYPANYGYIPNTLSRRRPAGRTGCHPLPGGTRLRDSLSPGGHPEHDRRSR